MKTLLLLLFSLNAAAQGPNDTNVTLMARNKPVSCQFVFAVDSDLYFEVQNPSIPVTAIEVSYKDEYTGQWSKPKMLPAFKSPHSAHTYFVATSLRSMSTNPKYLLRSLSFKIQPDRAVTPQLIFSEFARQFGEKCYDSPDETPYLPRALKSREK